MLEYINVPGHDVLIMEDPMSFNRTIKIVVDSMETLDNIIEQCRDIKLKLLEGNHEG